MLYTATRNEPDYHHNHDDHQKNVNESSSHMKREPQKPHDQQDYRNSPKHSSDYTFQTAI